MAIYYGYADYDNADQTDIPASDLGTYNDGIYEYVDTDGVTILTSTIDYVGMLTDLVGVV